MKKSEIDRGINNANKTFIVEIKNNQNDTWQGSVTWVEEQRKDHFRSALELIALIDSAIGHEET